MSNILVLALAILASGHLHLPATFSAPDDMREQMELMLERSPTFRRQVERLTAHTVFVRIHRDVCLLDKPYRARTVIERTADGPLIASIAIGPIGTVTEWVAHEFEHVIEQIEGLRLADAADRDRGTVWRTAPGAFETIRAVRAGRLVASEMREAPRVAARSPVDAMPRGDD